MRKVTTRDTKWPPGQNKKENVNVAQMAGVNLKGKSGTGWKKRSLGGQRALPRPPGRPPAGRPGPAAPGNKWWPRRDSMQLGVQ